MHSISGTKIQNKSQNSRICGLRRLLFSDKNADRDHGGYRSEPIKNDTMVREQRRYYLDLMENHRGMFLKVRLVVVVAVLNI